MANKRKKIPFNKRIFPLLGYIAENESQSEQVAF